MRRFEQNVARICKGKKMSITQAAHKIRSDVVVRSSDETQADLRMIQFPLQLMDRDPNLGPGIIIESGQNVRRAGDALYALRYIGARHIQGDREFFRPIIHAR